MKRLAKKVLLLLGFVITSPMILLSWLEKLVIGEKPSPVFGSCKEILAFCPTPVGEYLRLAFYKATCRSIASDVRFMVGSMLAKRDITIDRGTVIGAYSLLGHARIGKNVLIAAHVSLLSGKYQHGKPGEREYSAEDEGEYVMISIGDNCWIGQGAVIMANVGSGCTVSAGSVVYKDVADGITVMGNPARKVSM